MLVEEKPSRSKRIAHALRLRCPNCGNATVFYKTGFQVGRPKIKESCDNCGFHFVREPGFFTGAVILSYVMSLLAGVLLASVAKMLVFGLSERDLVLIAIAGAFFTSSYSYRFSRILWLTGDSK